MYVFAAILRRPLMQAVSANELFSILTAILVVDNVTAATTATVLTS